MPAFVHVLNNVSLLEGLFQFERVGFALHVPTADVFGGQRAVFYVCGSVDEIASRGDGGESLQRTETAGLFEFSAQHLAGTFQEDEDWRAVLHTIARILGCD